MVIEGSGLSRILGAEQGRVTEGDHVSLFLFELANEQLLHVSLLGLSETRKVRRECCWFLLTSIICSDGCVLGHVGFAPVAHVFLVVLCECSDRIG